MLVNDIQTSEYIYFVKTQNLSFSKTLQDCVEQGWIQGGGMGDASPHRTQAYKGESPNIMHKLSKIGPKCRKQRVIPSHREFLDPPLIMSATVGGTTAQAHLPPHCGWVSSHEGLYSSTNVELAVQEMNWIGNSIHQDLTMVELNRRLM